MTSNCTGSGFQRMAAMRRDAQKPVILCPAMPAHAPPTKLGDLAKPAERALADLLRIPGLKAGQWMMRLSVGDEMGRWEPMAIDTATNDRMIKEKVVASAGPVTELAMGYAGMIDWRSGQRFMAYLQYFKAGYEEGLLCLRHLKEAAQPGTFEGFGGFLIVGACKNIWI